MPRFHRYICLPDQALGWESGDDVFVHSKGVGKSWDLERERERLKYGSFCRVIVMFQSCVCPSCVELLSDTGFWLSL